jgi:hypothetical protein
MGRKGNTRSEFFRGAGDAKNKSYNPPGGKGGMDTAMNQIFGSTKSRKAYDSGQKFGRKTK